MDKFFYRAGLAERNYRFNLSESRKGINLDENDLYNLAHLICPLIRKGQSIYTILTNHPEIKLSVLFANDVKSFNSNQDFLLRIKEKSENKNNK